MIFFLLISNLTISGVSGKIMLEIGDGQAAAITEIFEAQNWIVEAVREDYTRRQRIFIARR